MSDKKKGYISTFFFSADYFHVIGLYGSFVKILQLFAILVICKQNPYYLQDD